MRKNVLTVEEYIALAPKEIQGMLKQIRQLIKAEAPQAEESISYGMPGYKYRGPLVYFGFFKNHLSLFCTGSGITERYRDELKGYKTTKSSIHFPFDQPLPVALIKKVVRIRLKENGAVK